jgi:ethanolamine utilization protein EutQ (cupin superfamily)
MSQYKVDFASLDWDERREGVRQKVHCADGHVLRLVEFSTSDGFEHLCEQGHIGYVLAGGLVIEYPGEVVTYGPGDGLFIPAGKDSAHRALSITPGTKLLMVEED